LLQRPSDGFKFRRRMMGISNFNFNSPGGSSGIFKDLKNSGE
ncbi:10880_t:CDS:1, partial [Funneliformis geosporum]